MDLFNPFHFSVCTSAWRSVRHCAAVLPSWWKDSSDAWAPSSTLRTGLRPLLIFQSSHYPSQLLLWSNYAWKKGVPLPPSYYTLNPQTFKVCVSFAGLAAGSLWRCTWPTSPATLRQSLPSCSTNSPALTSRWALPAIQRKSKALGREEKKVKYTLQWNIVVL